MAAVDPHLLLQQISDPPADANGLRATLDACNRLTNWIEARRLDTINRLGDIDTIVVEHEIAHSARTSISQGCKARDRAATIHAMPAVGDALANNQLTPAHVDTLTHGLKRLPPAQQQQLAQQAAELTDIARTATVSEFRTALDRRIRMLEPDDGCERLARQRRANRFDIWRGNDGMINGRFTLDPETGMFVQAAVQATVQRLFHTATPEHTPSDPLDKQSFLRAHALHALVAGGGVTASEVRVNIHIDERTLHHGPHAASHIDAGGADIPIDTVRRWVCNSPLRRVIMSTASEPLDLGRERRLASPQQRTMLRAIHPTCFIPGCDTPFHNCQVHHINPFAHGGNTNLTDLRPVCTTHHHALHEGKWRITHHDGWHTTITQPDGTSYHTRPPDPPGATGATDLRELHDSPDPPELRELQDSPDPPELRELQDSPDPPELRDPPNRADPPHPPAPADPPERRCRSNTPARPATR